MHRPTILIVDDEPVNLSVLKQTLSPAFQVRACKSGEEALRAVRVAPVPELILLDIMMPGMDGYEVLGRLQDDPATREIPVIYITALDSMVDEEKGFHLGAVDYITKPFRPVIVLERTRVHLELKRSRDFLRSQNEWLEREVNRRVQENQLIQDTTLSILTELAETRDSDTGNHIVRTQSYIEILARRMRRDLSYAAELSDIRLARIIKAAPLHDIGKIGIRDSILLKPGKLTEEEFEIMKRHSEIGAQAIRIAINKTLLSSSGGGLESKSASMAFLEEAEIIAKYHHEKWDGTGYPEKLSGDQIPLSARLMALVDVFDALTTHRPYKAPWTMEEAASYIKQESGRQFDPAIVDAFLAEIDNFDRIRRAMADDEPKEERQS